ncbi:QKIA protein, partial [Polypterus senegalus]
EITRVRKDMYSDTVNGLVEKHPLELPEPAGPIVHLQEKLFVPVKEYPDYNFVGRILGPRGLTAKQLEAETGCKIMVRGKSSMRDKKKEEQNRGKPNWEHLNEDLHVLITVEDTQCRAEIKMRRAVEEVKKLLVPAADGEDNLKKMQLMELAILNGTYRDTNIKTPTLAFSLAAAAAAAQGPRLIAAPAGQVLPPTALRPPTPAGTPIMNIIRPIQAAAMLPNGTPTLVPPTPEAGIIYATPYDYPYALAPTSLLEYPIEPSGVLAHPEVLQVLDRLHLIAPPGGAVKLSIWDVESMQHPLATTPTPNRSVEDSISHGAPQEVETSPPAREAATKRPRGGVELPMVAPQEHVQQGHPGCLPHLVELIMTAMVPSFTIAHVIIVQHC